MPVPVRDPDPDPTGEALPLNGRLDEFSPTAGEKLLFGRAPTGSWVVLRSSECILRSGENGENEVGMGGRKFWASIGPTPWFR